MSLIAFAAATSTAATAAGTIRVTKHQKYGMSETDTTLHLIQQSKGKCLVSIETAMGRSDEKEGTREQCKSVAKMIAKLKVARDEAYVQRYCAASFEKIVVEGQKEKFYCIKGRRSDGKQLVGLNKNLQAIAVRNLQVDF
jgi:hypothetical protein